MRQCRKSSISKELFASRLVIDSTLGLIANDFVTPSPSAAARYSPRLYDLLSDQTETKTKEPWFFKIQKGLQWPGIPRYNDGNLQEKNRVHHLRRGSWPVNVSSCTHIRCSEPQLTKDLRTPIPRRKVIKGV